MKSILLLWTFFVSICAEEWNLSCDGVTKESIRSNLPVVQFDDFFAGFQRMKLYSFNCSMQKFRNEEILCPIPYYITAIIFNWNKSYAISRQRIKGETKCTISYFWKDNDGFLWPNPLFDWSLAGFKENLKSDQRIYYFHDISEYEECQLISSNHNPAFVSSYSYGNCDLALLNLKRSRKSKKFPCNNMDAVISDFILIVIAVTVSLWLASRWFYSLPSSIVEPA